MTVTHDYAALCAAIDDGDDIALLALADLLEENCDPRSVGLRQIIAEGRKPFPMGAWAGGVYEGELYTSWLLQRRDSDTWRFLSEAGKAAAITADEQTALGNLPGPVDFPMSTFPGTHYRLYSSAFLALAAVLAPVCPVCEKNMATHRVSRGWGNNGPASALVCASCFEEEMESTHV